MVASASVAVGAAYVDTPPLGWPACLFKLLTGGPCPACGMTRAFIALGHGRLGEAVGDNLASPLLFLASCLGALLGGYDLISGQACLRRLWRQARRVVVPIALSLAVVSWSWNIYKACKG